MNPEIIKKLQSCPSLPSPPTIAIQIINLVNQPEIEVKDFTKLLNCDPALASKILRIANSGLYAYPRKVESLQQAIMVLGLNATVTLALSFSLVRSLKTTKGTGLDYKLYWKRALLSGTVARAVGATCELHEIEELYLASLLQDLGMLGLDLAYPELYTSFEYNQACHDLMLQHEWGALEINHGAIGSWLLTQWNFPDRLRMAVAGSDDLSRIPESDERAKFVYCVSLAGKIAEIFLRKSQDDHFQKVKEEGAKLLNLSPEALMDILETTRKFLPETEQIFEMDLQTWSDPQSILDHARDALMVRSLQTLQQVEELKNDNAKIEAQFTSLEEIHRYDPLTGAITRAYLDKALEDSFRHAIEHEECLTLIFGDLDKFKSVNDTYGHQVGDHILQATARILLSKLRTTDTVGRYGGEEFVLILPKAPPEAAEMVCQRIVAGFQETSHEVGSGQQITVTISLGYATLAPDNPYSNVQELLKDADEAVYYSKTHGGNQSTFASNMKVNQPA